MVAESLKEKIKHYASTFSAESVFVNRFLDLIQHPDAFLRTHLPGHITGSAFIASEDYAHTLLVHHAKLNKWIQPGGHADGDHNIMGVALREANEETGLRNLALITSNIFDLDIHVIPARKDFPQHDHYDVRFLVQASMLEKITVSEESHDVRWVGLAQLEKYNSEAAVLRMREKLLSMIHPS